MPASDCCLGDTNTSPAWTRGIKKYGNYYEGVVERADLVLEMHKQYTITGQKSQDQHLQKAKRT